MKRWTNCRKVLLPLVLAALCGCSGPQVKERYFWPRLPETPRIEWLATYSGTADVRESSLFEKVVGSENNYKLQAPTYITSDGDGMVYVTDQKNGAVMVFDLNKKAVWKLAEDALEKPTYPTGIALDANRNLYVIDGRKLILFVYDSGLSMKFSRPLNDNIKSAGSIVVDQAKGRLLVPDLKSHKIAIFDLEGKFISSFGKRGLEDGELNFPTAVALDKEGNIYVCDSQNARIQKFSPDGKFLLQFGKRGDRAGEFAIIKTVAVDSEGHIYVTDGKINNFSIFSDKGDYLLSVGAPYGFDGRRVMPGGFLVPQGIFIDKNDTIYIADQLNGRFQMFQYMNEKYLQKHPVSEGVPAVDLDETPKAKSKK